MEAADSSGPFWNHLPLHLPVALSSSQDRQADESRQSAGGVKLRATVGYPAWWEEIQLGAWRGVTQSWEPFPLCVLQRVMVTRSGTGPRESRGAKAGRTLGKGEREAEGLRPTSKTGTSGPCSVAEYHGDLPLWALKLTHRMKAMLTKTDPVTIRSID